MSTPNRSAASPRLTFHAGNAPTFFLCSDNESQLRVEHDGVITTGAFHDDAIDGVGIYWHGPTPSKRVEKLAIEFMQHGGTSYFGGWETEAEQDAMLEAARNEAA